MKRKDKVITILGISVLMCSLFLVTIPVTAIAAEEDDYVLGVYGNANEDDMIDMRDLTYVKLIFFGKKPETELADAKYDGKINPLDFIQIKLIIVGKEKELTIVDSLEKAMTVDKPVKRIFFLGGNPLVLHALKVTDKIVGESTGEFFETFEVLIPELSKLPKFGTLFDPDIEGILSTDPDIVLTLGCCPKPELLEDKIPESITVVRLDFWNLEGIPENVKKLGYIFDEEDAAEEFRSYFVGRVEMISERIEELSDDEKPRVYPEFYRDYRIISTTSGNNELYITAGGRNIAANLPPGTTGTGPEVDPEWIIEQNPDIIVRKQPIAYTGGGGYGVDDPSEMNALGDSISGRPVLATVNAVKNGRVYVISDAIHHGPMMIVGLAYLAKWFHPELFEDLDPVVMHQEYLDRLGIDYDVKKHGVFVYNSEQHPDGK
jgi:iron complex transport system substrate-binding protein